MKKNIKKILSLILIIVAVVVIGIFVYTNFIAKDKSKSENHEVTTKVSKKQEIKSPKQANNDFKWNLSDYEAIKVGDSLSGAGGENLDDITKKFGEPSQISESSLDDLETKSVEYNNLGAEDFKLVAFFLTKQENGNWLAHYKYQIGLD